MICVSCGDATDLDPCASCGGRARVDGRYALEEVIGRGAHGTTYRAIGPDGVVAVKEALLRKDDAAKARELVRREAKVLRQLSHPAIPPYIEEIWVDEGRTTHLFLVQGFVEGLDLRHRQAVHRTTEAEVVAVLLDLCDVLGYLHGLSPPVVHRDIKPANVLRTPEGAHVLVDFGAVRDAMKDADLGGSTVAGTFGYMAPEQFAGDASPLSDLYGLGALGIALLTRRDPATLQAPDRTLAWRAHATVSPALADLLDRLTAPVAADRPPHAQAVAHALRALGPSSQAPATPDPPPWAPDSAATAAPAPRPVAVADPPPRVDPEPFHQPPAAHQAQPPDRLMKAAGGTMAALGALLAAALAAVLVVLSFTAFTLNKEISTPVASPAVRTAQWPVMSPLAYEDVGPQPACTVHVTDGERDSSACPAPLAGEALRVTEGASSSQVVRWPVRPPRSLIVAHRADYPIGTGTLPAPAGKPTQVLDRAQPTFPEAAKGGPLRPARCATRVVVAPTGEPHAITVSECPVAYHQATVDALAQWRWTPSELPFVTTPNISYRIQ